MKLKCMFCDEIVSSGKSGQIKRHKSKGAICEGSYWSAYSMSRRMEHVDLIRQLDKLYRRRTQVLSPKVSLTTDAQILANGGSGPACRGSGNRCTNNAIPNNNGFCYRHGN